MVTTNGSGQEKTFLGVWIFVIISVLIIAVVLVLIICIRKTLCHRKLTNRTHNEAVFSSVENGEGDEKYVYIEREPFIQIEDEEMTCLIPQKDELEQDIQHSTSDQSLSRRFSQSESAVNNIQDRPSSKRLRKRSPRGKRHKTH